MSDPGKLPPMPPPNPPRVMEMYCPAGEATIISPDLSAVTRSMTAPCPAKIPRVGKVTAVVNPASRAVSMRRSETDTSSAILTQLVVWGRSWGPRERAAARGAGGGGGAARLSPCAQCVDQAWVDGEPLAFHQHGVGRNRNVLPDGFNQSIAYHHRPFVDDRAGDGNNLRVVYGHCRMRLGQDQRATQE